MENLASELTMLCKELEERATHANFEGLDLSRFVQLLHRMGTPVPKLGMQIRQCGMALWNAAAIVLEKRLNTRDLPVQLRQIACEYIMYSLNVDKSEEAFHIAIRFLARTARDCADLGNEALSRQRFQQALDYWEKLCSLRPNPPAEVAKQRKIVMFLYYLDRSDVLWNFNQYDEAFELTLRAKELASAVPDDQVFYFAMSCYNRGVALHGHRQFLAAMRWLEVSAEVYSHEPDRNRDKQARTLALLSHCHLALGSHDHALSTALAAREESPNMAGCYYLLIRIYMAMKQPDAAHECLTQMIAAAVPFTSASPSTNANAAAANNLTFEGALQVCHQIGTDGESWSVDVATKGFDLILEKFHAHPDVGRAALYKFLVVANIPTINTTEQPANTTNKTTESACRTENDVPPGNIATLDTVHTASLLEEILANHHSGRRRLSTEIAGIFFRHVWNIGALVFRRRNPTSLSEAIVWFARAQRFLSPEDKSGHAMCLRQIGYCHHLARDPARALEYAKQAIALDAEPHATLILCLSYMQLGDIENAHAHLRALAGFSGLVNMLEVAAHEATRLGQRGLAAAAFEMLLDAPNALTEPPAPAGQYGSILRMLLKNFQTTWKETITVSVPAPVPSSPSVTNKPAADLAGQRAHSATAVALETLMQSLVKRMRTTFEALKQYPIEQLFSKPHEELYWVVCTLSSIAVDLAAAAGGAAVTANGVTSLRIVPLPAGTASTNHVLSTRCLECFTLVVEFAELLPRSTKNLKVQMNASLTLSYGLLDAYNRLIDGNSDSTSPQAQSLLKAVGEQVLKCRAMYAAWSALKQQQQQRKESTTASTKTPAAMDNATRMDIDSPSTEKEVRSNTESRSRFAELFLPSLALLQLYVRALQQDPELLKVFMSVREACHLTPTHIHMVLAVIVNVYKDGPRDVRRAMMQTCLDMLVDVPFPDLTKAAVVIRQMVILSTNRAESEPLFHRAIELIQKYGAAECVSLLADSDGGAVDRYPQRELWWLVVTAWNNGVYYQRLCRLPMAERWISVALQLVAHLKPPRDELHREMVQAYSTILQGLSVHE